MYYSCIEMYAIHIACCGKKKFLINVLKNLKIKY